MHTQLKNAELTSFFSYRSNLLVLFFILILGISLLVFNLGSKSFWDNEVFSILAEQRVLV